MRKKCVKKHLKSITRFTKCITSITEFWTMIKPSITNKEMITSNQIVVKGYP